MALTLLATVAVPAPTLAAWSGWSEVPGGGTTLDRTEAVTYKGALYLFARGGGDHMAYVNVKDGSTWSNWFPVPGGQPISSPISAAVYNQELWLFATTTAPYENVISRNIYNGLSWSGWAKVASIEYDTPEAVVYDGRLWIFWRSLRGDIFAKYYYGSSWSSPMEVPGNGTSLRPVTAAVFGSKLWLFVSGTDNRLHRNTFDGLVWSGWSPLPGAAQTQSAPAATVYGGRIWLFITSDIGEIWRNRYKGSWSGWAEVPGGKVTPSSPSATVSGTRLWLFVRGSNDRHYVNKFRT